MAGTDGSSGSTEGPSEGPGRIISSGPGIAGSAFDDLIHRERLSLITLVGEHLDEPCANIEHEGVHSARGYRWDG
jgi:hypothetical protein